MDNVKVLITEEEIQNKILELAKQIEKDYEGKELVLLSVLRGGAFFTVDLAKRIKNRMKLEFLEVTSYEEGTVGSDKIKLHKDISGTIEGKDILVVEDIIDTGNTLKYLIDFLKNKKPSSVKLCTLLSKPSRRTVDINVDYLRIWNTK